MGKITRVTTKSHDEWLALRHQYIGGSDAAAIVGMNAYSSPYALWAEKTGKTVPFTGNLATEVGSYLEEFVAKKFEQVTGKKVRNRNQSFLNADYPFAIANIDREIVGEDAGLEIKTTNELNLKKFKNGDFPSNYYAQIVHYMAVTGKQKWYLAVLVGNREFLTFEIHRDQSEIDALMDAEDEFWGFVKRNEPPSIDGELATTNTINEIYSEDDQSEIDLFGVEKYLERAEELKKEIDSLQREKDECINRVKDLMGTCSIGESDRWKVTWKQQKRKSFDDKRFVRDHPDVDLSGYYKESVFRMFKIKKLEGE